MGLIFFHSLTITMTCRGTCSLYKNYPLLVSSGQSLVKLTFFSSRTQITCHSDKASFLTWFMNYGNMENHPPCLLYLFAPTDNGKNEMSIGQQWSLVVRKDIVVTWPECRLRPWERSSRVMSEPWWTLVSELRFRGSWKLITDLNSL